MSDQSQTKASEDSGGVAAEGRLRQLESIFLGGPIQAQGQAFSLETLLDILVVLYDECCNSSLRREKTVSDFIEFGKCSDFLYTCILKDMCLDTTFVGYLVSRV